MSYELKYRLIFEGGEADRNRLPAHEGATSLEGISWSVSLLGNYAATGDIRTRGALSRKIQVYLQPARPGSFINDLVVFISEPNNLFLTTVVGTYAVGTVGQMVNALIVSSVKEVCGWASSLVKREEDWLKKLPSGDREALVDKIEPSMRRAHEVIGEGATTITLKKGYTPLLQLDHLTKAYVNADLEGDLVSRTVSVGAYNANTGNGRFYLPDVGKTVPFYAAKGLDQATYAALSYSLDAYVNGVGSLIDVSGRDIVAHDGRVKKILLGTARKPKP